MEITICYFFIYLVEGFILLQYASNMFYPKTKVFAKISLLVILYTGLFAISFSENFVLNTLSFLLVNFIYLCIIYHTKWLSAFFHATILTVAMGFSELLIYSLMTHFAPAFFSNASHFRNLALLAVFSKILYYIITLILTLFLRVNNKELQSTSKTAIFLLIVPVISTYIMLTLFAICTVAELNRTLDWMLSISAFLLLIINLLIFAMHSYNQKKRAEFTELQLLLQKEADSVEYYKMLFTQMENQRILIHDIKQHLQSISILCQNRDYDKIDMYVSQLVLSSDLKTYKKFCDNELLNVILNRYYIKCDDASILLSVDIRTDVVNFMDENDLTALFCNLLDNAVESATKTTNGFIEMNICLQPNTPYTLLTLTNSCRKTPFIGNKLISNKKNSSQHGFGMKSIKRIVAKYYGEIKTYYSPESLTFHSIITLKNTR